ncbi:MAG: molybdate ABC transporter substrate-binding protein [Nitrospinaceae bacterium]|nr:molybdate ABC transporter substrate-binding protein [Nitrospinaceae bacterium]NIR55995.1 molybdate ABC transporter substrate-binding protein [Nitrospinaceae bacterium]NIS86438.1 molybdate ABC transporter substrate-binding protein [Nitrospinaceae bacterium]NIT83276.1 molybdate ABC transporter substrate-binding protein [Nitrospinaceae bacterium]NIU45483.1 molybdate ABC transporter substrate-binding protein [Nitrospinaceae bacterium]
MVKIRRRMVTGMVTAFCLATASPAMSGEVTVAVATNFLNPFKQLVREFHKQTGHTVRTVSGSTGKLYAQIRHGAPFQVFLAADSERPRRLETQGQAVAASRFIYARGKIVLWSADPNRLGPDGEQVLRRKKFRHLALANPKTAPYGKAALTVLHRLKLHQPLSDRLVQGENIGQTFQFIATHNAELGFVALSQILDPRLKTKGSRWDVPENLYDPIDQEAVLLKNAETDPAALALVRFLKSDAARNIIQSYGYGLTGE